MTSDRRDPYAPPEAPILPRVAPVPRSAWPWWVKLCLFGIRGRWGLQAFLVGSLASAVLCCGLGFSRPGYFAVAVGFLVSALLYWLPMRWIDRNGSWSNVV